MKKKMNKDLIIFIILIPTLLGAAFYISSRMDNQLPAYSVINKSNTGISVFYEALKKLDYPVERTLSPINDYETDNIQIIAVSNDFNIKGDEINKWVEAGGTIIYMSNEGNSEVNEGFFSKSNQFINTENIGKGTIITVNGYFLSNQALIKKTDYSYDLLKELDKYNYKKIYFNEHDMFSVAESKDLWSFMPLEIKFVLYEALLALIAFLYYKGKRFGKTVPLYEEVERTQNEYLYSTASLYKQAKCYDIIIENYYKSFLKQINKSNEEWLEYWKDENLPQYKSAKKVYEFMEGEKASHKSKEYIEIVTSLEKLSTIAKKRSDMYWKTLKKTM